MEPASVVASNATVTHDNRYTNDAVLIFEYDDATRARRVERALRPEVGDIDGDRSTVSLARDGQQLELTVDAADLVALRAGLNTWLSLVRAAEQAGDVAA